MPVEDLFHELDDPKGWIGAYGTVTQFGGPADSEDSGGTASGFSTISHPDWPYVALPIPVKNKYHLKYGMAVVLQHGQKIVCGAFLDLGPSASLMRVADVSPSLMKALGGDGLLTNVRVMFRK